MGIKTTCGKEKKSIRKQILEKLARMPPDEISRLSAIICARLCENDLWQRADTILAYLSMPAEVQTDGIIRVARTERKEIGVPRISGTDLEFYSISSPGTKYSVNRFGIREPEGRRASLLPGIGGHDLLLIVPGLAFNAEKNRLGRGGGYYDRLISSLHVRSDISLNTVGVFFQNQYIDRIPVESWDEALDFILTEIDFIA